MKRILDTHYPRMEDEDPETAIVYTDGSVYPNPNGKGGWAFYCARKGGSAIRYGCARSTTNNAMELTAILHALLYVPAGPKFTYPLIILTDSQYCKKAIMEWAAGWEADGWKTASGKPVKNKPLIERIRSLTLLHQAHRSFQLRWVRGHVGIPENELVDQRAGYARKQQATNWKLGDAKNRISISPTDKL